MRHLLVIGGGIVGTMHAFVARRHGWSVTQIERDRAARSASVRNFGLVWVSGRAAGPELDLALRARELWGEVGRAVPGTGFRANGSLTVARTPGEVDVLEAAAGLPDAAVRGFHLLGRDGITRVNPAVAGDVSAALHCTTDAAVEPRLATAAVQHHLAGGDGYELVLGRTVVEVDEGRAVDHHGRVFDADAVIVASGDVHDVLLPSHFASAPLQRCRLQMMQTAPFPHDVTTSIADGDSLRYYPAFAALAAELLPPAGDVVHRWGLQLLLQQRLDGGLTIGDTHAYDEPFDFDVDAEPYEHLARRAEAILGTPLPPIRRRWAGVYSKVTDDSLYHRASPIPGVHVVTGLAGRGMTLSPAVAEQTLAHL